VYSLRGMFLLAAVADAISLVACQPPDAGRSCSQPQTRAVAFSGRLESHVLRHEQTVVPRDSRASSCHWSRRPRGVDARQLRAWSSGSAQAKTIRTPGLPVTGPCSGSWSIERCAP
jgi:hypothetical protein